VQHACGKEEMLTQFWLKNLRTMQVIFIFYMDLATGLNEWILEQHGNSVRFEVLTAVSMKVAVFRAIALMMEAASTTQTSVYFYQTTRRDNAEDSHLQHGNSMVHNSLNS
jgi:hypothetical protein